MRGTYKLVIVLLGLATSIAWAHDDPPTGSGGSTGSADSPTETPPAATGTTSSTSGAPTVEVKTQGSSSVQKWVDRFKGTLLIIDQSVTPDTLSPGVQLTQVPSYQWWFSLRPRFYFTPKLSLRVRLDLTLEWLNAADTTLYREAQFGDIWTDVVYTGIPKFLGIDSAVGIRFLFPTSKSSQMHGNILGIAATLAFSREFKSRIGEFEVSLAGSGAYTFASATTGGLVNGNSFTCQTASFEFQTCTSDTGKMNTAFQFVGSFSGRYSPHKRVSLNVTYLIIDQLAYKVPDSTITSSTGGTTTIGTTAEDQRLRQFGWFLASVDVEALKWLSFSLGYYVYRPVLDPGGSYGNPFWSPGGNTRIFFSTNVAIDMLMQAMGGRSKSRTTASTTTPKGIAATASAQDASSVVRF